MKFSPELIDLFKIDQSENPEEIIQCLIDIAAKAVHTSIVLDSLPEVSLSGPFDQTMRANTAISGQALLIEQFLTRHECQGQSESGS